MTNNERIELAAKKILQLVAGALEGLVTFQIVEMPDKKTMYAICFETDKWEFTGTGMRLKIEVKSPPRKAN